MRNFTIYFTILVCLFVSDVFAQKTFYDQVKIITQEIDQVTVSEKLALKNEIETVNSLLEKGEITQQEALIQKNEYAEKRAKNIEEKVNVLEAKLRNVVQERVDGKIKDSDYINDTIWFAGKPYVKTFSEKGKKNKTFKFSFRRTAANKKILDSLRQRYSESRTTNQFVFSTGLNNLVTNGAVANSDFRYFGSHFYEWGTSWNYRINKENNLLHFKYGISLMYNNLRPTDNRKFVDHGTETTLEVSDVPMRESRFRNVYIVVPMHFELDLSPTRVIDDKKVFQSHKSFRFGIGGYAGLNVKSKQVIKTDINGYKQRSVTKGDFNVNDFMYGVSTYIGYKETSLYLKYDLSPLFESNPIDQNNISLGIRFDLN